MKVGKKTWFVIGVLGLALLGYFVTPKEVWEKQAAQKQAAKENADRINQANFEKIQVGMGWGAVEEILGNGWKEVSAVGSLQTYVWKGGFLKSITIILDNNRVFSKSSMGLK